LELEFWSSSSQSISISWYWSWNFHLFNENVRIWSSKKQTIFLNFFVGFNIVIESEISERQKNVDFIHGNPGGGSALGENPHRRQRPDIFLLEK
jgi:hypothetical protein